MHNERAQEMIDYFAGTGPEPTYEATTIEGKVAEMGLLNPVYGGGGIIDVAHDSLEYVADSVSYGTFTSLATARQTITNEHDMATALSVGKIVMEANDGFFFSDI